MNKSSFLPALAISFLVSCAGAEVEMDQTIRLEVETSPQPRAWRIGDSPDDFYTDITVYALDKNKDATQETFSIYGNQLLQKSNMSLLKAHLDANNFPYSDAETMDIAANKIGKFRGHLIRKFPQMSLSLKEPDTAPSIEPSNP